MHLPWAIAPCIALTPAIVQSDRHPTQQRCKSKLQLRCAAKQQLPSARLRLLNNTVVDITEYRGGWWLFPRNRLYMQC